MKNTYIFQILKKTHWVDKYWLQAKLVMSLLLILSVRFGSSDFSTISESPLTWWIIGALVLTWTSYFYSGFFWSVDALVFKLGFFIYLIITTIQLLNIYPVAALMIFPALIWVFISCLRFASGLLLEVD